MRSHEGMHALRRGFLRLMWCMATLIPTFHPVPSLCAQEVATHRFLDIEAESSHGFTRIAGVRELNDGRVLVVDGHDRLVYLLSADLAQHELVSRHGQGPREYLMPQAVFALGDGRSAVYDGAQARFLMFGAEGVPTMTLTINRGPGVGRPAHMDRSGFVYARGLPVARNPDGSIEMSDSAAVQRWHPDTQSWDTLAFVPVPVDSTAELVEGIPTGVRARDRMPFRPIPIWALAGDGALGVVRPEPYAVEIIHRDGARHRGNPVAYDPVPLSEAHKEQWRAEREGPRPARMFALGEDRQAQRGVVVDVVEFPFREPRDWPDALPPYVGGAATFAPDGTLWVERTIDVGEPLTFDVFARSGNLSRRVQLPATTRLVGFGGQHVFVVRKDEFDLEYLQRIPVFVPDR